MQFRLLSPAVRALAASASRRRCLRRPKIFKAKPPAFQAGDTPAQFRERLEHKVVMAGPFCLRTARDVFQAGRTWLKRQRVGYIRERTTFEP
jgi:hypothetical protein